MCALTAGAATLITWKGCFFECVRWQSATLYWYWDEPEWPYCDTALTLRASAGAPSTPSGTRIATVTTAAAADLRFANRFKAASRSMRSLVSIPYREPLQPTDGTAEGFLRCRPKTTGSARTSERNA